MAKKAATEPDAATITPPIAGPKLRAMLKAMLFSVIAAGSILGGTCSFTEDCQAGPNSAMPLPIRKQNTSRLIGVSVSNQASTVSATELTKRQRERDEADDAAVVHVGDRAGGDRDQHDRQHDGGLHQRDDVGEAAICVIAQAAPTP